MRYLNLLWTLLVSLFSAPPAERLVRHRLNFLAPSVPFRFHLHRCISCGRATAAPLTCKGRHHHCIRCTAEMERVALLGFLRKLRSIRQLQELPVPATKPN